MKAVRYWIYLAACLITCAGSLFCLTGGFAPGTGFLPYVPSYQKAPGRGWYVDAQPGMMESQTNVFLNDVGQSMENARRADVVLLGDSRALLGFDWRQMEEFTQRTGIRIFNLAIDGGIGWEFPMKLMKKYDIRPKLVVLTIPEILIHTTWGGVSDAENSTRFTRMTRILANEVYWRMKNVVASISIEAVNLLYSNNMMSVTYRSVANGCWFRDNWIQHDPFGILLAPDACGKALPMPDEFRSFLEAAGCDLVISNIPMDGYCPQLARNTAESLHVSYLDIPGDGLTTYDHDHLDQRSSVEYSKRFLDQFEKLSAVQALMRSH